MIQNTQKHSKHNQCNNVTDVCFQSKRWKLVKIKKHNFNGLIDKGSQSTLLREAEWKIQGLPPLSPDDSILTGFGSCHIEAIGFFQSTK